MNIQAPKYRDMPLLRKAMDRALEERDQAEWDNDFTRADYWHKKYEQYKEQYDMGEQYAPDF